MQTVDLLVCRACGGQARPLLVHRSERASFAYRLGQVWRYPFTPHGLALVAGLGALLTFLGFVTNVSFVLMRLFPAALAAGTFWSTVFAIVRSSARGEPDVPLPDFSDFFQDWLVPALRGLLATSPVWLTLLLYFVSAGGWDVLQYVDRLLSDPMFYTTGRLHAVPGEPLLEDPIAWLLGLAGLAYLPMALMLAAAGIDLLDLFNPVKAVRAMRRLGRDYLVALGALLTLGLVFLVVRVFTSGLRAANILVLSSWLSVSLECLVAFVMARVLGLLLYTRGDALGYGDPGDYLTPLLDAAPSTSLRAQDAQLPPPPPGARLQELARAVQARDVLEALSLYAALELPKAAIAPELHLFVGQAAATYEDYALAVRALESAADVAPDDPIAPRALVLLARVLGERMREPARARDVYQYIVDRYPDTEASRFARARLPPTS
jgi:tetratricopeptide (TPR) repeat protein